MTMTLSPLQRRSAWSGHPVEGFWRRLEWGEILQPVRPVPKLLLELVRDPAGAVFAVVGDPAQLAIKVRLFGGPLLGACPELDEFTFFVDDVAFWFGLEAAGRAVRHLWRLQERALWALRRQRLFRLRLRLLALAAVVELVVVDVRDEAKPEAVVAVIENQAIAFAVGGAEAAPDHLHEQHFAFKSGGRE
ncbi:hypothetical protein ACVWWO_009542 [Bradyrhizobium sp. F1.13.1]